jgi:nucleoside-diphosphate-sugar epimerase
MITVAVTGGTGFIGRALVEAHLRRGDHVRVLTRRPGREPRGSTAFYGDLADHTPADFADGADVLYHLAAELGDPSRMAEVNVRGTRRLLDATIGRCGRWVQLSSVGVYGSGEPGVPITESTVPKPTCEYERSKLEADHLVMNSCNEADLPWCILRPSNVVGATMRNQSAFHLARAVARGRFFYIGRCESISTYVHVDDVVGALIALTTAPHGTVVNVSSDCRWTCLVERICDRVGRRPPRLRIPYLAANAIARSVGSIPGVPLTPSRVAALSRIAGYPDTAARRLIDFRPSRPMPAGFDEITDRAMGAA